MVKAFKIFGLKVLLEHAMILVNNRKHKGPIMMLQSLFFREFVGLLKRRGGAESEAASAGRHGCTGEINTQTNSEETQTFTSI